MKKNHTPEPWTCRKNTHDNGEWVIQKKPLPVADVECEADARRIVACVNACAGINPEAVPDLIKACQDVEDVFNQWTCNDDPTDVLEWFSDARIKCFHALAKAGGE